MKSCFSLSISLQAVVFDGEEQAFQSVMNGKASFTFYHKIPKRLQKLGTSHTVHSEGCKSIQNAGQTDSQVAGSGTCAESYAYWKTDSQVHASRNKNHFKSDISCNVWANGLLQQRIDVSQFPLT